MAKAFDATTKQLVEAFPADWLRYVGLPLDGKVSVVDADVSSVTAAADKVIRVDAAQPYLAHLEFQSSGDPNLDRRMLLYNTLLRARHGLPVWSVVVLLRPEARSGATGRFRDLVADDLSIDFRYRVLPVWEQRVETLLSGGLGRLALGTARRSERGRPARRIPPDRRAPRP
jgi:hypothetical protein